MKGIHNKNGGVKSSPITPRLIHYNYVPLDYFKGEIINLDINNLINNKILNFGSTINEDTGELIPQFNAYGKPKKPKRVATFKGLIFQYYTDSNRLFVQGSFHMFYNDGVHNYNDFDITAFYEVLNSFYTLFKFRPCNLILTQLEWGVNILPPIKTNIVLDHIMYHLKKSFELRIDNVKGKYKQSEHMEYILKYYNKALHFNLDHEIMRIERKQINYLKYSKSKNIGQTLQNLIDSDFIDLRKSLLKNWNEVILFDPLIKTENHKILKYRDPITWHKIFTLSRPTQLKKRNRLKEYNQKLGGNIQGQIYELINDKITALNKDVLTIPLYSYTSNSLPLKHNNSKLCSLTNIDISMQRSDSFLMSHTGLKYYLKNDLQVFNELKNQYLTSKWLDADIEIQIKEIAHLIRTRHNQKLIKREQRIIESTYQYSLFENKLNKIISTHWGLVA